MKTVEPKNEKFSDYPNIRCIFTFTAREFPDTEGQQTQCNWALQTHAQITMIQNAHGPKASIKKETVR